MGLGGLACPQPRSREWGEVGVCLGKPFPAPSSEAEGPGLAGSQSLSWHSPSVRSQSCVVVEGAEAGSRQRQLLRCSVGCGPGDLEQAGSRQRLAQVAGRRRARPWPRSGPRGVLPAHPDTPRCPPPDPTQAPERLLLFGEEAESLLLVLLAKAGIKAGDGGQRQALGLDTDALGLVDGSAQTLQPGQHLLLQGREGQGSSNDTGAAPVTDCSGGGLRSSGLGLHLPLC